MPDAPEKKKRKKPFASNARAMDDLEEMGFTAGVVEKRLPHCFITKDFLNCIDIIAVRPGIGILGIQATAGHGKHTNRKAKAIAEPQLRQWLLSGGRMEIWTYTLGGAAGTKKKYSLRREEITLEDLPADPTDVPMLGAERAWHQLRSELAADKFFCSPADVAARMDSLLKVDVLTEIRKHFAPDGHGAGMAQYPEMVE